MLSSFFFRAQQFTFSLLNFNEKKCMLSLFTQLIVDKPSGTRLYFNTSPDR